MNCSRSPIGELSRHGIEHLPEGARMLCRSWPRLTDHAGLSSPIIPVCTLMARRLYLAAGLGVDVAISIRCTDVQWPSSKLSALSSVERALRHHLALPDLVLLRR